MSEEREFLKEFECLGKWRSPGNYKEVFFGKLRFSISNGGELELLSEVPFNIVRLSLPSTKLIFLGTTDKGNITLFDCRFIKNDFSPDQKLFTATFNFNEGVIGAFVEKKEDFKIQNLLVNYSYLSAWCDTFGIQRDKDYFNLLSNGTLSFEKSEPLLLAESNDYKIFLDTDDEENFFQNNIYKQISLQETIYINISLKNRNTLKDYREFVESLQYFLTIAIREQVMPLILIGTSVDGKQVKYFQKLQGTDALNTVLIANFSLSIIKNNSEKYLQNWIENRNKLSSVCELYFTSLNPNLSLKLKFFYLIQAVETFHRNFLAKKSKYCLRRRLEKMLCSDSLKLINNEEQILDEKEVNGFIKKAVDTRDYFTHYLPEFEEKIFSQDELPHAIKVLKALLEVALLYKMGFEKQKIEEIRAHPEILWPEFKNKTS